MELNEKLFKINRKLVICFIVRTPGINYTMSIIDMIKMLNHTSSDFEGFMYAVLRA